jgi:hypothetical protein
MMRLNINSEALVVQVNRLEEISRSAAPVAVRGTLNSAAYDVKGRTMPAAANIFVHRRPTFFKATSKVQQATGFDINTMEAIVGFVPPSSDKAHAVEDLAAQESGGSIGNRAFIAMPGARVTKSWLRNVKTDMRMGAMKSKIVNAENAPGHNDKEQYIQSALHVGRGGFVIGNIVNSKGNKMVMRINSIVKKNGRTFVNATAVYSVKAKRRVHPKATHFMEQASLQSGERMEVFFGEQFKRQLDKLK